MNLNPNWKPKNKWYEYSGIDAQDAHAKRYKGRVSKSNNTLLYLSLLVIIAAFISYLASN